MFFFCHTVRTMNSTYKYCVTVGDHPYSDWKHSNSEQQADKVLHRLSSKYVNTQVDFWKWNDTSNEWDHIKSQFTCSWR